MLDGRIETIGWMSWLRALACLLARAFLLSLSPVVLWSLSESVSADICKIGRREDYAVYICCRSSSINLAAETTSTG